MKVSLIVPSYNEREALPILYEELCRITSLLGNYNFEFMFVDDGSVDKTLDLIKELALTDDRIKYISFSKNFGKEAAIYAGLENAEGDAFAILDADMQDPPSLLPEMLRLIFEEGYDSVSVRRVSRKGEPPIRSFFSKIFYRLINKFTKVEIADGARDFKLVTAQVRNSVLSLKEYNRFSKGIFGWVGYKNIWIETENVERAAGSTKWSFWKLFMYAIEGIVEFTTAPLRISAIMGIFFSIFGFIYMFFIIIRTIFWGVDVPGYASLLTVSLFIGGIMLFAIGIVGEYVARIYTEVKQRPLYIIKETNK
jgi:glycosyltransferase involved in cell wall biosynthesis